MAETSNFADVWSFHADKQLPASKEPILLSPEMAQGRIDFMREELDEYEQAVDAGSLARQFDALLDLVYVAMGTAVIQGLPWQEGWDRVHRTNTEKVRDRTATDYHLGLTKPPGWRPPELRELVEDVEVCCGCGIAYPSGTTETLSGLKDGLSIHTGPLCALCADVVSRDIHGLGSDDAVPRSEELQRQLRLHEAVASGRWRPPEAVPSHSEWLAGRSAGPKDDFPAVSGTVRGRR